jgi:hypothetical protein
MAVRLRRAPPRRRRGPFSPPVLGVGLAALLAIVGIARCSARDTGVRVLIEPLPRPAGGLVPASARNVDGALISLPPLAPPRPFLTEHRVVSFYGNPLAQALGVLGEQDSERTIARLRAQADAYARLSDDRRVVPAIHLIFAVAQSYPGADGSYLLRMEPELVERWVRLTRDNGLLLFLDIQIGRSTVEAEIPRIYPYLAHEHVHVALDPEFAWGRTGIPGEDIGHLDAADINRAQQLLQQFAIEHRLPTKMLIVHQFLPGMVRNKAAVRSYDRVELVFDADGFGPRPVKIGAWEQVIQDGATPRAAIKLFYRHDPDLMSPADVLSLDPKPVIIIYQ